MDPSAVPDDLRDPQTPPDVVVMLRPPAPVRDPTLGIHVTRRDHEAGRHGRGPVQVDFTRLIARDTLISDPPACITPDLKLLGWANDALDWVKRMGRIFSSA